MDVVLTSNNFHKTKTKIYLLENFQRFENSDSTKSYDVYLDSSSKIKEYIGLSMVYKEYDKEGRTTKRIGYNLKGDYFLWDFAPIIQTYYSYDSITNDYYNYLYKLHHRNTTIKDSLDREVESINFDKNLKFTSRSTKIYDDYLKQVIITNYDVDGNLKPNKFGVSIQLKKFNSQDFNSYSEEYFYDSNMKLIDADHKYLSSENESELKYSQIKSKNQGAEYTTIYYNAKGRVICEEAACGELIITSYK
jgi:hypothetical protein